MSELFREWMPIDIPFLAPYLDFCAFFMIIALSIVLSAGVKESSVLNNIFTAINLATVVTVIGSGVFKGKPLILIILSCSFYIQMQHKDQDQDQQYVDNLFGIQIKLERFLSAPKL